MFSKLFKKIPIRYRKVQSDRLKNASLTENAIKYILANGTAIDCHDFSGIVVLIDKKYKVGVALDILGEYHFFKVYRSYRIKNLKQSWVTTTIDALFQTNFIEIMPFKEFIPKLSIEMDASKTQFVEGLFFDDSILNLQEAQNNYGKKGF